MNSRLSFIAKSHRADPMVEALPKIGFVSLGCPKALVDSEYIITRLRSEGYNIVPDYASAHLIIVNTCGFIDSATEESLDAIGEALEENGRVIVMGCLGERSGLVKENHPKVLEVLGSRSFESVMDAVHAHLAPPDSQFETLVPPRSIRLTPRHYAYLKVSEGCNHRCSFCIIPSLRGDLRSEPLTKIMHEAENLVASGVQEILIIAQDTSAYGLDLKYEKAIWAGKEVHSDLFNLAKLLGDLGVWIRLHYVYPYPQVDKIIPLMAEGRILPYLDIPLQHGSDKILRSMARPANSENVLERIKSWRKSVPDLTLRSSFIVGFPGETENDFLELLDFLSEAQLDRVGAFTYSAVDGAAANDLPGQVPDEVKQQRYELLMQHQARISRERLKQKVGREIDVIIDSVEDHQYLARSKGDAPEIDGLILIPRTRYNSYLKLGQRVKAKVTNLQGDYDLQGKI